MAFPDNRPQLDQLKGYLKHIDVTAWSDAELQQQLDNSIAWVEDEATTSFNGRQVVELYDGNTTNQVVIRKKPVTSVIALSVETPILGFIRVYAPTEIKLYRKQGVAKVFTYKLAVEQAMFNTLDYQAWGTIFPPLPQAVHVTYTYGYPSYDAGADQTALDFASGSTIVLAGDQRDPEENNWLTNLKQAAALDAACAVVSIVGARVGIVASMSFDGYSRTLNAGAYQAQVQMWNAKRDELLKRRKRQFYMSTVG